MKMQLSSGRKVGVYVSHARPGGIHKNSYERYSEVIIRIGGFGTLATVVDEFGNEFEGKARLSHADHFNRHKGLTVALKRAVGKTDLSKGERRELWEKVLGDKYAATPRDQQGTASST